MRRSFAYSRKKIFKKFSIDQWKLLGCIEISNLDCLRSSHCCLFINNASFILSVVSSDCFFFISMAETNLNLFAPNCNIIRNKIKGTPWRELELMNLMLMPLTQIQVPATRLGHQLRLFSCGACRMWPSGLIAWSCGRGRPGRDAKVGTMTTLI
jgi:hypothetical protein